MKQNFAFSCLGLVLLYQGAVSLEFNVTALSAQNGSSILQCWQMDKPFETSSQPGTTGTSLLMLSDVSNLTYGIIPPNFDGGVHNAPQVQWVIYTSGLAYITLPDDPDTNVMVSGGEFGLIFAADTADVSEKGHRTQYPGVTETTALEIPTADGKIPEHRLLHTGPCSIDEITGIRELRL
ncbi:replication factor C subunit 4 [Hypoxylon texense]